MDALAGGCRIVWNRGQTYTWFHVLSPLNLGLNQSLICLFAPAQPLAYKSAILLLPFPFLMFNPTKMPQASFLWHPLDDILAGVSVLQVPFASDF